MDEDLLALIQTLISAVQQLQRPPQPSNQQLDQSLVPLLQNLQQNTTNLQHQQYQFQYLFQQQLQLQLQQLAIIQPLMANLHQLQLPPHVTPLCFNPHLQQINNEQMISSLQANTSSVLRNNSTELKPECNKNGFTTVYKSRIYKGRSIEYYFIGEKFISAVNGREQCQPLSDVHYNQMKNDILTLDDTLTVKRTNIKLQTTPTEMELVDRRKCENQDQCPIDYYILFQGLLWLLQNT